MFALLVLMAAPVFGNGVEYYSDLVAGQDEDNPVGEISITFNMGHTMMYITYLTYDCDILETHLWYGTDLEDVPRTGSGNPKIGQFPEIPTVFSSDEVIYELPISSGETYFVLAHAVVDCPCMGEETAWGEGPFSTMFSENQDIFGSRWGYYITVET